MTDFMKELYKMALSNPELQEAIAQRITSPPEYSIPTRKNNPLTKEATPADPEQTVLENLASWHIASQETVGELAKKLEVLNKAYTAKEEQGEELTPQERTLKDLDIIALSYTLLYMDLPPEAYHSFESVEEYEKARAEIISKVTKSQS